MPLIANLFTPARTLKPSTHTPAASSTATPDNPPSFNNALDSALQPQRSPAPQSPVAAKPENKPQRSGKKTDQTDDVSNDQPAAIDDSTSVDASTVQTPVPAGKSDEPAPTKKPTPNDGQVSNDLPADPTIQQIAVAAAQPQPLPIINHQLLQLKNNVNVAPINVGASQPEQVDVSTPQNAGNGQQTPAKPLAPTPKADASPTPPTANPNSSPSPTVPQQTAETPAPVLNQVAKRTIPSATPAAITPAKKTETASSTVASKDAQLPAIPPENDVPTPSPLAAQHANPKFTTSAAQSTQSTDSSTSQTATPAPIQSQPTTPDVTLIAESTKSLALSPTTDDPTPAPPQSSATPLHTLTTSSSHPVDNSATPAAPAQDSPRAETDPTFDQIVLGLRTKMDATHSRAEISLNPPNLGTLHVSVSLQNGSLTAQFQSSSEVVRDLLKGNMEKLKSVLESQGVTVDNLAVGAPQDKTELPSAAPATAQTNQSANDGRSAGQYNQEPQNRKRSQDPGAFAKTWHHANAKAPIDLVA